MPGSKGRIQSVTPQKHLTRRHAQTDACAIQRPVGGIIPEQQHVVVFCKRQLLVFKLITPGTRVLISGGYVFVAIETRILGAHVPRLPGGYVSDDVNDDVSRRTFRLCPSSFQVSCFSFMELICLRSIPSVEINTVEAPFRGRMHGAVGFDRVDEGLEVRRFVMAMWSILHVS